MGEDGGSREKARAAAHWAGVGLNVVLGLLYLAAGMRALFIGETPMDWLGAVLLLVLVLALLSMLPLAIAAIFRPRLAAKGVGASFALIVGAVLLDALRSRQKIYWSVSGVAEMLLLGLAPPCVVVALLLYASAARPESAPGGPSASSTGSNEAALRPPTPEGWTGRLVSALTSCSQRDLARWTGVGLGVSAGVWRLPLDVHLASEAVRLGYWLQSVGIAAMGLTLLPLSAVAIFRPRLAAYGALGSLAAALACPLAVLHPPELSVGSVISTLALNLLLGLPLALVTVLLLYASSTAPVDSRSLAH